MANAPFPIQPTLTAVAIRYSNRDMIADQVAPRVPVFAQEFEYLRHTVAEGFTVPDTRVGRKSQPREVEFTAEEVAASTEDYGLDDVIPQRDIDNAPANYDPLARATEGVMNLLLLDREQRVADLVFGLNTYAAANRATLSGTAQWSDYSVSNPLDVIMKARDAMVMPGNVLVLGQATWTAMRQHTRVVQAVYGTAQTAGIITREQLAAALELDEVLVGRGLRNTARLGREATYAPVWGKHAALIRRDTSPAGPNRMPTFCWTAQFGTRIAGSMPEPKAGLRGGVRVRAGESVKEVISANDLGYFWQNAVA